MDTFLSRIKNTVGSVGRDGAGSRKGKSNGRSSGRSSGRSGGRPGGGGAGKGRGSGSTKAASGKAGGRTKAGRASSWLAARSKPRTKAGPGSGAGSGTGPGNRSRTTSAAKGRAAKKSATRGGSRGSTTKKQADDAKQNAGSQAADVRRGPPTVVRVFAMLVAFGAMVAFAGVLSRLTLEPSAASESIAHTNLQPGESIRAYLSQPAFQDTVKQLGGNIVLGVPFGVLLPVLIPRARGFIRVTAATALVMLLVELVQGALITGRAFDIDDVILNSAGAFIGYLLLGRRLGRAVHPPRRRWWHRWIRGPVAD